MKVGTMAPTPGIRPSTKPTPVPRRMAPTQSLHSWRVGIQLLSSASIMWVWRVSAARQQLGHAEQAHDDGHEADAVEQLLDAEGEARRAAHRIEAAHGEQQADHRHQQGGQDVLAARPTTRQSPATMRAKNSAGPNFSASEASGTATTTRATVAKVPPTNEPMAAIPRADPARPWRRHLVAVDAGDHRRRLARHVDQHRGDGAAIHGAVVDGAQHDDGAGWIEAEGERDQDRRCRPPARGRQHADQCAQRAAREGVEQVLPGQRRGEAREQVAERLHDLESDLADRQEHVQPGGEDVVDAEAAEKGEDSDHPPAPVTRGDDEGGVEDQHREPEARRIPS
jgi:hypothetical protein